MMKQKIIYTFLISLPVFCSCNGKEDLPKNIIPEDKMVNVITEVELTQGLIKLKFSNQDSINQQELFGQVYDEFNITKEQFNESLTYYCQQPKLMEGIYNKVINNLSEKQAQDQ